jgi:hypothetical protein
MTRSHKVLGFFFVAILGAYGCARGPAGASTSQSTSAEAKAQRLEEDFKAATAARDSFRQRLLAAEEKQTQLQRQLELATATTNQERQEKERMKGDLRVRTAERDLVQLQYEGFRKNIRDMLAQADSALSPRPSAGTLVGVQVPPAPAPRVQN